MPCFWTDFINCYETCGEEPPAGAIAYYVGNDDYPALVSVTWGVVGEYAFPLLVDGEEFIPDGDLPPGIVFYGEGTFGDSVEIVYYNSDLEEEVTEVVPLESLPDAALIVGVADSENFILYSSGPFDFSEDYGPFTIGFGGGVITWEWSDDINRYHRTGDTRPVSFVPDAGPGTFSHGTYGTHDVVLVLTT